MEIDFAQLSTKECYLFLVSAIVPRPIAWVSTINRTGQINIAPFSFFNGVSAHPPTLVFSIARKRDGSKKDTLINIEETQEFVVNASSEWHADPVHETSADYDYGISEMEKLGITAAPSSKVQPPRVADAAFSMECRLEKFVEIGEAQAGGSTLVIGRILSATVRDEMMEQGVINVQALKPIARLGGNQCSKLGEVFSRDRPQIR